MEKYKQGDIVFVPFPYSNLNTVKYRPALIVSNTQLKGDDIILCGISSQKTRFFGVPLNNVDLVKGELPVAFCIKVNKILSLHNGIVKKRLGSISSQKLKEVITKLVEILKA